MDLHNLHTYIRPQQLEELTAWDPGWNWLAGGTWLFSQPQPHLRGLVDLQPLGWDELEICSEGLTLGATCTFERLLQQEWPPDWPGIRALCDGIAALASFKVAHCATVGGNLCLALTVGVMAPVLIALEATYTLVNLQGSLRQIPASQFQIGPQQTLLQAGEALRRIWIPAQRLRGPSSFQRLGLAQTDPALVIVVGSRDPDSGAYCFGLNAAVSVPQALRIPSPGDSTLIPQLLQEHIHGWIADFRASSLYRRRMSEVLIRRCLAALS
ncbi:FAD binding domain-containing protein [Synechococcus sp. Nb3U1]|uniref:FAD binding domain-containing protein n=1 Tax=Synechococcus sp. Nb3U1 TaxID=1914529 RepID=UPI001F3982B3|nr:FAD binding domain-containing protein [Synechococcus sp. Nb3U1]MCF2971331.1 FAD binding domain-containing protein [Synechococcus sp. Nb3U1]